MHGKYPKPRRESAAKHKITKKPGEPCTETVIPTLRFWQEDQKFNDHPWPQSKFKTILDYKKHRLKTQTRCRNWKVRKGRPDDNSPLTTLVILEEK